MTLFGLPLHPLVVHAAVVLLPLAALGAIVIAVSARARKRFGWPVVIGAITAAGAAVGARVTGESLAGGTTGGTGALATHMTWGLLAPWFAGGLAVATLLLVLGGSSSRPLRITMSLLAVIAALAGLAVIVIVGHSGSTSVWGAPS